MRNRARKIILMGLGLTLALIIGGAWFVYAYVTDSNNLAALIKAEAPRYLPGSRLELGRVRVRPLVGEANLTQIVVRQEVDGSSIPVLRIPWLQVRHDARALLKGRFVTREVTVAQPSLRLRRRKDGTWNVQGLVADPWPDPPSPFMPTIQIQNGTVELSDGGTNTAILRDVYLKVVQIAGGVLQFEGTARGDAFDRLGLNGTIDQATGRVTLMGDVARLAISETLRKRLPVEVRAEVQKVGLTGGEVDFRLNRLLYDPKATPTIRYEASAQLRSGVWNCPKLPFPIHALAAGVTVRDGVLTIERAEGHNGLTTVRAWGMVPIRDPERDPMDLSIEVVDLEIDHRLKAWTPPEFANIWDEYRPKGRASVAVHVVRDRAGGPVGFGLGIDCLDVAMTFHEFRYPLEHLRGRLSWEGKRITADLRTLVGGKPFRGWGTIDNPGPDAHIVLNFEAEGLPIDKTLHDALPPEVRLVLDQFQPTGSVRGHARVERTRPASSLDDPKGKVIFDAFLDLNERCAITWVGMPYPVNNLTGRLELHPESWIFKDMRGGNGQAVIIGNGRVDQVGRDQFKVDLHLNAEQLPFDDQLRMSLPIAWRKTWTTLNPTGSSDVDATIQVAPGQPDSYHLEIVPRPETGIRLEFTREPKPGVDPGGTFDFRMDDVSGRFIFDNGTVVMNDVGFQFRGSPVQFVRGTVVVENSGRFRVEVSDLWGKDFRLDAGLRKNMPPLMAQFARRLDNGKVFTIRGNLGVGWSGQQGQPAWCRWENVLVVLNDNTIQAGLPLEHLQGQLDHVQGWFNGQDVSVQGALHLDSVSLGGQQFTRLESPFSVESNRARLNSIRGSLLGGELTGQVEVSLDATPRYAASMAVENADLQRYTKTLPERQTFRGLLSGRLDLTGLGSDLRTLQGSGEAHIRQGDLGQLPVVLRLIKTVKLSPATKTAFDSADLTIKVHNGESRLDPIKLTGDAFSLLGRGTLAVQGALDLRLHLLYGRDTLHLPFFSDALREMSGQLFVIRVEGSPAFPKFKLEPLPKASDMVRSIGSRRNGRAEQGQR